jgi:hypothetical protein
MQDVSLHVRLSPSADSHLRKRMKDLGFKSKRSYILHLMELDEYELTAQDI